MPWKPSRRSRISTKEQGKDTEATRKKSIPNVVTVTISSPPALITATQTKQHPEESMNVDDGSVEIPSNSTNPMERMIPKPPPSFAQ